MPSSSKKQHNFMAAVANSPAFAKKAGVPQSVGQEFTKADKGRKFAKGGDMKHTDVKMDKSMIKSAVGKHAAMPASKAHAGLKAGGKVKMASGGLAAGHKAADGIAKKGKTKAKQVKMAGGGMYKKGGMC
jgi:hypothetical protein